MNVGGAAETVHALGIDHATLCGPDLASLQEAFTKLGLTPRYGGAHASGGTHMAIIGFEDGSYLELVAPVKAGTATDSDWSTLMLSNAGPCAWAVRTGDIQRDIDALKHAGVPVDGPFSGGRKTPEGKVLKWQTAALGTEQAGAVLPFMIQDHTPREWRVQSSPSARGLGISGVMAVVLGVKDIDAAIALFQKTYGWRAPEIEKHAAFGAKLACFGGTPVILATPLHGDSWLTKRLEALGDAPVAFLLRGPDFDKVSSKLTLDPAQWCGMNIGWFDADKLQGARVGVIARP
jgi:hypothetical protein